MTFIRYGSGLCKHSREVVLDADYARQLAYDSLDAAGGLLVGEVEHRFTPHGVTVALIAAESHLVLSTWPEHSTITLDVALCGDGALPTAAWEFLLGAVHSCAQVFREWTVSASWEEM